MLIDSADNLLVLITELLDFSRIENSELEIHKIDFNIRDLVNITIGNLSKHAEEKGLSLNCRHHLDNGDIVNGDKLRIGQILVNLVTNAVKFTQQGSVDVEIEKSAGQLRMVIHDSGIGISREDCSNIFTSFRQIENTYTKTKQGIGLGLSIVKSLIDLMDGSLSVESEPGKGSTFTVIIPIGDAMKEKAKVQEKVFSSTGLNKILVVEDEAINRIYMVRLLQKKGWTIIEAEDGIEAVKKYQQEKPDFIIMDVGLPGLDGISATKIIRESEASEDSDYRAHIIALTAHAFDEDIANCLNAGMDDYLSKPVQAKNLLDLIESSNTGLL
jgi:CheY-like chemotaxis protein